MYLITSRFGEVKCFMAVLMADQLMLLELGLGNCINGIHQTYIDGGFFMF